MSLKNLSIIICNYNLLEHLKIVSKRVKELSPDSELILADDHSDDGSYEWAKSSGLFDNIYYKPIREPYCLCTIRNEAIKLATREYILLLDSSCYPADFCLDGHIIILEANKNNISQGEVIWLKDMMIPKHEELKISPKVLSASWLCAAGGNLAFPKSSWDKIGGFDEAFNGAWGHEDNDFLFRLEKAGHYILNHFSSIIFHMYHETKCQESKLKESINLELFKQKHFKKECLQENVIKHAFFLRKEKNISIEEALKRASFLYAWIGTMS